MSVEVRYSLSGATVLRVVLISPLLAQETCKTWLFGRVWRGVLLNPPFVVNPSAQPVPPGHLFIRRSFKVSL